MSLLVDEYKRAEEKFKMVMDRSKPAAKKRFQFGAAVGMVTAT